MGAAATTHLAIHPPVSRLNLPGDPLLRRVIPPRTPYLPPDDGPAAVPSPAVHAPRKQHRHHGYYLIIFVPTLRSDESTQRVPSIHQRAAEAIFCILDITTTPASIAHAYRIKTPEAEPISDKVLGTIPPPHDALPRRQRHNISGEAGLCSRLVANYDARACPNADAVTTVEPPGSEAAW